MKILLAVDGSVCSDFAVEEVAKRPWPPQSKLKVITAVETPAIPVAMEPWAVSPDYFEELDKSIRKVGQDVIDRALVKLNAVAETLKISSEVIQGSPGQVVVDEAENWGADLIVMGSRGLGAWSRLLLGSVSNAVVHHATCSVEIVRTPERTNSA